MANALTIGRIVLSVALLVPDTLSAPFFVIYVLAGVTDMIDGYVARRTGTESELGARLDSVADLVLVAVCLVKVMPAVDVPMWLWVWVAAIAVVKVVNAVSGFVVAGKLVMPHTMANKVAGFVVFLVPLSLPFVSVTVPGIVACAVATFAAVQEEHLIRTGAVGQRA